MFPWRLLRAVCVLSTCVCVALAYEDVIKVSYTDDYTNEIAEGETEPTPSTAPCSSADLNKWDKIFSMLENSQMRENMLLQYAEDTIKIEMGSLREELLRFVAHYGGSCGDAVESTGRRMALQLESHLREVLGHIRPGDQTAVAAAAAAGAAAAGNSLENPHSLEEMVQQLLTASRTQASRFAKLENNCFSGPGAGMGVHAKTGLQPPKSDEFGNLEQEVTSRAVTFDDVLAELQQMRMQLEPMPRSTKQCHLPAGCDVALLFPMRSRRIYTAVIPDVPLSTSTFTVCMWVKPTTFSNKTVLFSYGNRRNPYEIQLLLGQASALFTIGGEAHLVEARAVVSPGQWTHLCGTWSSEQGQASLWAGGIKMASTPGVAEGHVLPDGGSLQLGQERNGCCPSSSSSMSGFEEGFDKKLAFAGKMTGVNMWDRVLSEEEISQLALQGGDGCEQRGNVIAWGVTEMVPHGGAQFIN